MQEYLIIIMELVLLFELLKVFCEGRIDSHRKATQLQGITAAIACACRGMELILSNAICGSWRIWLIIKTTFVHAHTYAWPDMAQLGSWFKGG
jgi:hypothetical protein